MTVATRTTHISPLREPDRCDQCGIFVSTGHTHSWSWSNSPTHAFGIIDPVYRRIRELELEEQRKQEIE